MQMQFHFQDGRPKQKRHRCRNPNKIDVNSLTGEERVQIINRRNARKVRLCLTFHLGVREKPYLQMANHFIFNSFFLLNMVVKEVLFCCIVEVNTVIRPAGRWSLCASSEEPVPVPSGEP